MRLATVSVLVLFLAGCQFTAQRPAPTEPVPISIATSGAPRVVNAAFVILPQMGSDGVQRYEIRPSATGGNIHSWPLEAEIRAFSRMSARNGGPTYSLAATPAPAALPGSGGIDPRECVVDPELRRILRSKKSVCYTTEDAGTIAVYTLPR